LMKSLLSDFVTSLEENLKLKQLLVYLVDNPYYTGSTSLI